MKDLTQSMWDFLHGAYEQEVLHDLMQVMGERVDKDADLSDVLGNMEDFLAEADFTPMEEFARDVMPILLAGLAQEQSLHALKDFLAVMRRWLGVMEEAGIEPKVVLETVKAMSQSAVILTPVILAIAPNLASKHGSAMNEALKAKAGGSLAGFVNSLCRAINRNPKLTEHIVKDVFRHLNVKEINQTIKTLGNILWEQRPPIARKPAAALAESAKKRLLKLKEELT